MKGIFNGLIGLVEGMINRIIGAVNGFIGGFNDVVGWGASFIGVDWEGLQRPGGILPRLAKGGIVDSPHPSWRQAKPEPRPSSPSPSYGARAEA